MALNTKMVLTLLFIFTFSMLISPGFSAKAEAQTVDAGAAGGASPAGATAAGAAAGVATTAGISTGTAAALASAAGGSGNSATVTPSHH